MTVFGGTEFFGAVRSVNGAAIVTKFTTFAFLPVLPLESHYQVQGAEETPEGVPVSAGISNRPFVDLTCKRLSRMSVAVAYARAIGGAITLLAAVVAAVFIFEASRDRAFRFQGEWRTRAIVVGGALAGGLALAALTYPFTIFVPSRERRIRQACARALGVAADPAKIKPEAAAEIVTLTDRVLRSRNIPNLNVILRHPTGYGYLELDTWLVRTRAQVRTSNEPLMREKITDDILKALDVIRQAESKKAANRDYGASLKRGGRYKGREA